MYVRYVPNAVTGGENVCSLVNMHMSGHDTDMPPNHCGCFDGVVFCVLQVDGQLLLEAFLDVLEGFPGVHSSVQLRMQLLTASLSFLKFAVGHAASALQCTSPDPCPKVNSDANVDQAGHMYGLYLTTSPQAKPLLRTI